MGDFRNDQMNGEGTIFFKNGSQFTGNFLDGKKNGKGFYRDHNGVSWEETWVMNILESKKELNKNFYDEVAKFHRKKPQGPKRDTNEITQNELTPPHEFRNSESPDLKRKKLVRRDSRIGNETLSIQEFREDLGSFDDIFESDLQGKTSLI